MKKTLLTIALSLVLTVSAIADGETPITGVQGCAPGLWYPISQVCCMPGLECPVGRPAPAATEKPEITLSDAMLVKIFFIVRKFF
jgi:hypothetical protein